MKNKMLTADMKNLLAKQEFVYVASSNLAGVPNVAPKFLITFDDHFIYLADHVIVKTFDNLRKNPQLSITFSDWHTLSGYVLNGKAQILERGQEFEGLLKQIKEKEINFTVERIVRAVQKGKRSSDFEMSFPERVVIIKMTIEDAVKIYPTGRLERN